MTGREARRNNQRLEYKFFIEYFKSQHNDLYEEACSFYDNVKEKNPHVRDLTKTVEFVARMKPNEPIPRYYYHRQARATPTPPKQTELTMVLNIPLTAATNLSSQTPPIETTTNPPSQTPPIETTTNPPSQTPPIEEPLMLGDDTFHHLMSELQQDPDLWSIFNNFGTPNMNDNYDDDGMNPAVWNDLNTTQDISLSEMELR